MQYTPALNTPALSAAYWEQCGIEARDAGQHAQAEIHFAKAIGFEERPLSWLGLALSQMELQRSDAAIESLRQAKRLSPGSGVVTHLLDTLTGGNPHRAPDGYVSWLFNTYAPRFDNHLASLAYQGPDMLRQLAEKAGWPADRRLDILDVGCGTGLSGVPFRPCAARLDGIDLAPRMLEQALRRGIYDQLHHGEAHDILQKLPAAAYDLVIAADTLIYIGDVSALFPLVEKVLKPGGSFLVTVETGSDEDAGYSLTGSGRYSHTDAYLLRCAGTGMTCRDRLDASIRIEAGRFTPARAYRFEKTA